MHHETLTVAALTLAALCAPALPAAAHGDDDVAEFCQTMVDAHEAVLVARRDIVESTLEAARAAAPEDVRAATDEVVEALLVGDVEALPASHAELVRFMQDNCGYETLALAATEYAFGGVPETVPAGIYVIELANIGVELHSMYIGRVKDRVTETLEEFLAMSPAEGSQLMTDVVDIVVAPDEVGFWIVDLSPGRYIALCFLPVGATPEHMPEIEAGTFDALRHHTEGMSAEFVVE